MKKQLAAILTFALTISSLAGCSGGQSETAPQTTAAQAEQTVQASQSDPGKEPETQAAAKEIKDPDDMPEYTTVYTAEIDTLNYLKTTNSDSIALFYSILDGLVEFDRFGEMIPCIAKDWTVSEDGLTYTMNLRDDTFCRSGAFWQCFQWFPLQCMEDIPCFCQQYLCGGQEYALAAMAVESALSGGRICGEVPFFLP